MIFSVTQDQFNLGTVFLIWSIHYVTGKNEFYQKRTERKETIPKNPLLNGITAHRMSTNHCRSIESFENVIDKILNDDGLNHVKFTPEANSLEKYHKDNDEFRKVSKKHGVKIINITCRNFQHLIGFLRYFYEMPDWQNNFSLVKEHCNHYWPHFFDNAEIFPNKLNTWHDIREQIAFNIRPNEYLEQNYESEKDNNVYNCQFENLLLRGKDEILKILKFLDCNLDEYKLESWSEIHANWSNNLKHYIFFCNDIDIIIENIVSNNRMDLQKYKMDVLKEGVILHFLMYKYDLNFKTIIDKLPLDTQKIHALLAKNKRAGIEKLYD